MGLIDLRNKELEIGQVVAVSIQRFGRATLRVGQISHLWHDTKQVRVIPINDKNDLTVYIVEHNQILVLNQTLLNELMLEKLSY